MSPAKLTHDAHHYEVIVAPVITEKATMASEAKPGPVQGPQDLRQSRRSRRRLSGFSMSRLRPSIRFIRKGKRKLFKARAACPVRREKGYRDPRRGHKIDVTTGL